MRERDAAEPIDPWYGSAEAAQYLGMNRDTLRKLATAGAIPSEQDAPGCKRYFRRSDLDRGAIGRKACPPAACRVTVEGGFHAASTLLEDRLCSRRILAERLRSIKGSVGCGHIQKRPGDRVNGPGAWPETVEVPDMSKAKPSAPRRVNVERNIYRRAEREVGGRLQGRRGGPALADRRRRHPSRPRHP